MCLRTVAMLSLDEQQARAALADRGGGEGWSCARQCPPDLGAGVSSSSIIGANCYIGSRGFVGDSSFIGSCGFACSRGKQCSNVFIGSRGELCSGSFIGSRGCGDFGSR